MSKPSWLDSRRRTSLPFNEPTPPLCGLGPAPEPPAEPTFEDVFEAIADEAVALLIDKQRMYGPANIESLGFYGVFDRLASDKIERIRHAMQGAVVDGRVIITFKETMPDESVEDALLDLVNYGLILLALKRGLWGAPLREDEPVSSDAPLDPCDTYWSNIVKADLPPDGYWSRAIPAYPECPPDCEWCAMAR